MVKDYERTDEAKFLAQILGEFNGIQAGENSQNNVPERTIVSSILTDLIFRRKSGIRAACLNTSLNQWLPWNAEFKQRVSKFKIDTRTSETQA